MEVSLIRSISAEGFSFLPHISFFLIYFYDICQKIFFPFIFSQYNICKLIFLSIYCILFIVYRNCSTQFYLCSIIKYYGGVIMNTSKSLQTITNSAEYLRYLKAARSENISTVALKDISTATHIEISSVAEDLRQIAGTDVATFATSSLIALIEHYLGYEDTCSAILVGVGNMGSAILSYQGFQDYGINIAAAFDRDPEVIGTAINGNQVLDIQDMPDLCKRLNVVIGILSVPAHEAQKVCDEMVASGIRAIWNFAPVKLSVPENVILQNENIADSLLMLSGRVEHELDK